MDRLTREMILLYIENAKSRIRFNAGEDVESVESRNAAIYDLRVHELALQSLSQEAVRDEALEEAARVCLAEALEIEVASSRRVSRGWVAVPLDRADEIIAALRRGPERPPSGEIVERWLVIYGDQLTSGARRTLRAMLAPAEASKEAK